MLVQYGRYEGIVGVVSAYGKSRQGFLPGDITAKSEVYFEPFYQAMITCDINPNTCINDAAMINQKNGDSYVTLLTHTYLRGTTFQNKVIILDECQNYTIPDLKKTLTRCSDSCKVIVIGHDGQIDLDKPGGTGFARYIEHFKADERCAVCKLTRNYRGWISSHADLMNE